MIRIDIHPRLVKSARKLGVAITGQVEKKLRQVAADFGDTHRHSGLGMRKLGRRSFEARVHLQWRIVFIREPDRLTAYHLMNHDQVSTAHRQGKRSNPSGSWPKVQWLVSAKNFTVCLPFLYRNLVR